MLTMKRSFLLISFFVCLWGVSSSIAEEAIAKAYASASAYTTNTGAKRVRKPNPTNYVWRDDFDHGNDVFTAQFLNTAINGDQDRSIITSPFSVLFLLAQLALFAKGNTYKQLANILNIKDNAQIRNIVPNYLNDINSQSNVTLQLAERVYGDYKYPFSKTFKRATRLNFYAEAENLDFSDAEGAADTINSWIASQTNNLIQDLVPSTALNPNTRLVLANAIYFKGDWKEPFDPKNTKLKDFHINSNNTISIKMMYQESSFNYRNLDSFNAKVIQMFYQSRNFSFVAILPNEKHDIMSLTETFNNANFSLKNDVIDKLKWTKVRVTLPLIETETSTNLIDVLKKNGVTDIFDSIASDLSGILEVDQQLFVSSAMQKAKIIVNESGSQAAAGNAMIVGVTAVRFPQKPEEFNANKPFLYFIMFKNTPIFAGIFMGKK